MEISLGLQGPLIQFFLHKFGSSSGAIRFSLPPFRARSRGPVSFILNALKVHRNFCSPRVKLTLFPPAWSSSPRP